MHFQAEYQDAQVSLCNGEVPHRMSTYRQRHLTFGYVQRFNTFIASHATMQPYCRFGYQHVKYERTRSLIIALIPENMSPSDILRSSLIKRALSRVHMLYEMTLVCGVKKLGCKWEIEVFRRMRNTAGNSVQTPWWYKTLVLPLRTTLHPLGLVHALSLAAEPLSSGACLMQPLTCRGNGRAGDTNTQTMRMGIPISKWEFTRARHISTIIIITGCVPARAQ